MRKDNTKDHLKKRKHTETQKLPKMYTYKKNLNGVIKNRQGKNTTKYFM